MPAEWIEESRKRQLERALARPEFTEEQRRTIQKMNDFWVMKGLRTATRTAKVANMRTFGSFIKKPFEEVTREDIQAFVANRAPHVKDVTLEGHKRVLKSFYKDLLNPDEPGHPKLVSWIRLKDPLKMVRPIRKNDCLTPDEIKAMVNALAHPRDRAFVMTLYDSGVRISELLGLHVKDVEFDSLGVLLHIEDGKTGSRSVRLIYSVPDLQLWLNLHPFKNQPDRPLWINLGDADYGSPLMHGGARALLRAAATRAGVKKRVWAHLLRHSNVSEWGSTLGRERSNVRYGWKKNSPMFSVYYHFEQEDVDRVMLQKAGRLPKEEEAKTSVLDQRQCARCHGVNPATAKVCVTCSLPLDQRELAQLSADYDEVRSELPALLDALKDKDVQRLLLRKRHAQDARGRAHEGKHPSRHNGMLGTGRTRSSATKGARQSQAS